MLHAKRLGRFPRLTLSLSLVLSALTGTVHAQSPTTGSLPTLPPGVSPSTAAQILQSRPDLVTLLRQRFAESGLTPDQVRSRLRAAGYPEDLLDAYLSGADSSKKVQVGRGVLEATRILGVLDGDDATKFERMLADSTADSLQAARDTSLFVYDSTGRATRKLTTFGLETFRQRSSQFQAAAAGPVDPAYRLGPGDELVLILTGDVETSYTLDVTREGFIVVPQVGQISVANLSLGQLEEVLWTRLGRVYSGVRRSGGSTRFQLSLSKLRTVQIFVTGDVARPGVYQVSSAGTVLTALYAAGGPTAQGSMRRVAVRRGRSVVGTVDLYDYLLRGESPTELRLQSGDVVFVPPRSPLVAVTGAVLRPARYEPLGAETLRDLIGAAGGFEADAATSRVQIHRIVPRQERQDGAPERVVVEVVAERGDVIPAFPIAPGDSVVALRVQDRVRRFVTIKGAVWREGSVGFRPGLRVSDALRLSGGLKPEALIGTVLISRLQPDSSRVQLRTALKDSTGVLTTDLTLEQDDEITVFSRLRLATERYVAVTGAVRKSGRIIYRDGMTLRDAVLLANGLTEDALLTEAEIARMPESRSTGTLAQTMRVPIDSSYLFDRLPDGRYLGPPGLPSPREGSPEVSLKPYDNVLILRQPQWELLRRVTISGKVRFPGTYALRSRSERLTDLIERAGGLTEDAYPLGVIFVRQLERKGRIGIDLPTVLRDPSSSDNFLLAAGDSVTIPEYNPVVTVDGAVNSPVAVSYVPGANAEFYVRAAGGFSRLADRKRTYVQQPTGKLESGMGRKPLAGARVFVPARDPNEPKIPTLQIISTLASVLASLATIVIVARQ